METSHTACYKTLLNYPQYNTKHFFPLLINSILMLFYNKSFVFEGHCITMHKDRLLQPSNLHLSDQNLNLTEPDSQVISKF